MLRPLRIIASAAVCGAVAAVLAAGATAGGGQEKIRYTRAGQAAAQASVLHRGDLGSPGWSGGPQKPSLSSGSGPSCANYHPKQSDLVVVGAAETRWRRPGVELDSSAQVLAQQQMVQLDWRRSIHNPGAVSCLRRILASSLGKKARLDSFHRISFPKLGQHTAAYTAAVSVTANATPVPMTIEAVVITNNRTEITLTSIAPTAAAPAVGNADVKLARLLVTDTRF